MNCKESVTFFLFLALLILPFVLLPATGAPVGGMGVYCGSRCRGRCSKAGFRDRCIKYCGICCRQCKCVPSGTFGNKHQCPCYRDMLSSKGKPKCP
ncbi:hypothetical protein Bca52824_041099 [Brassica carinata]|uniref:Uncharacterized protein n=1 Tax=Brassica carinata TaxID=52824 RepID=A0A8X7RWQ1_BRACI|nr:hypothetical protein Bca52824_041099 [Brassica carinata]